MGILSLLRSLWRNLVHRDRAERALDDELRAYVDLLAAEYERVGLSTAQARRAALIATGGVEQVKEATRDAWTGAKLTRVMDSLIQDVRFALGSLRRARGTTTIALLSLLL